MIFIGPETLRLRETLQGKAGIGPGRLASRKLCGTMQASSPAKGFRLPGRAAQGPMIFIGPETLRSREALQNKAGIGPGRLGQPEVTAAGVNARPTIPRKWVPGKETSAAKAKFPVSPAVCLVL